MGISVSVYPVTDSQISRFSQDPSRIDEFIHNTPNHRGCYLADFWDGLHFLLTGRPDSRELPLAALKRGDVAFRGVSDQAHAIFSRTTQAFTVELQSLTAAVLRERLDLGKMVEAPVYPVRLWLFPEHEESTFRELMFYFDRLRDVALEASAGGQGLLFSRYEDW